MLLPVVAVEVACVAAVGFQSGRWHSCPSCRREVLQWHRGGSVLTMTASCFVFLIAPIAELQRLQQLQVLPHREVSRGRGGVGQQVGGEDAAANGRR